ncbi:Alpha/Beta hydrolase protein [Phycomyces blakesleeanus]|uniref:AB hydrolase-1 domain-containing protein n=2 Tax=Phycomyces blakesleeanus TaxID=4837 RepID=A0A162UVX3_PHYB8|nr:hypothetical protein PHYBLDRAFT_157523 [Phycomyces blakesleeanus NRRL 1555(-)]OAD78332.1 hypothetical protein PHYBLDRAFT_157523 [Phycomyces blakesleeanus NRRL 1555(-)]|eukprot:XP_018296372.1 hypothetical protein PHYBLDRAFT_157523 [Phycomyces blakesleeanus NRRL 1555(-)]
MEPTITEGNKPTIHLPLLSHLPPVIPPTSYLNFLKTWWKRNDKTSAIAERRLLHFLYTGPESYSSFPKPTPLIGRILRVNLDSPGTNTTKVDKSKERIVNTFHLFSAPNPLPDQPMFKHEPETGDIKSSIEEASETSTKNLVVCHGYGAGLGFFYKNLFSFGQAPGWQVFAVDWLGMGRSSRPKWTFSRKSNESWDDIVDDVEDHFVESLEEWRKKVGLEKMTLMGHSLGGYFSSCYALKYPQRVEKLILVSPAGIPEPPPGVEPTKQLPNKSPKEQLDEGANQLNASLQAQAVDVNMNPDEPATEASPQSPPIQARKMPGWAVYLWNKNITPMSLVRFGGPLGATLVNSYTSRRFAHLETEERHCLYDYLYNITSSTGSGEYALAAVLAPGAYARKPLFHRLANLQMPVVFIYGEHDWMDYKAANRVAEIMKVPVKVILVQHGGHHMYIDNPEEFNEEVAKEMQ